MEGRVCQPMYTEWGFAAMTRVDLETPMYKISLQEAEKIERLQESIFMNFKFGSSFSNFSSQ